MASTHVEIASSAPFGCVLRDHNRRDGCRESNVFQKKLKNLVTDHLNTCISISSESTVSDENSENQMVSWHPNNQERKTHRSQTFPANNQIKKNICKEEEETLPRPEIVVEAKTSNLGAASLVQIWEKRLKRSNSINQNSNSSSGSCTSRSDSGLSSNENEEPFADWQSDRTVSCSSEQLSPTKSRCSDAGESERVRIADIIKRLSGNENDQEDRDRSSVSDQTEQRSFCQLISSPRIRGRQAFLDLLMQMERERHGELHSLVERRAVSRFPKKGRIQSMLRLRLLQRGMAVGDQRRRPQTAGAPQVSRVTQGTTIMLLRERFNPEVETVTTSQSDATNSRAPHGEIVNDDTSPTQIKAEDDSQNQRVSFDDQQSSRENNNLEHMIEGIKEKASPSNSVTWKETSLEDDRKLASQESVNQTMSFNGWDGIDVVEELEESYQQYVETNHDWISEISRPISYWEDRRQEWYHEMLNSNSEKVEIRQLLERGTVSSFLASDFRERMDRLMETHLERQTQPLGSEGGEEFEERSQDFVNQLRSVIQNRQQHPESEEEEEEENLISGQYQETGDYFDQYNSSLQIDSSSMLQWSYQDNEAGEDSDRAASTSPRQHSSLQMHSPSALQWSYRDNEVGEDSDRATSTSPRQHFPSQSYYPNTQQFSSSTNHPSIEMELIWNLRGQMEQLYNEMSELRKSLKSCMDMQQMILMQQSMKPELHSEGKEEGKKACDGAPKKGNCCICYGTKVDSLLSRCGHMCTCLKCAHELQWSTGKCPICRAPIVDVVRAYLHS
ncbi:hypothetical protein UlMin_019664 [Ulmus minor]